MDKVANYGLIKLQSINSSVPTIKISTRLCTWQGCDSSSSGKPETATAYVRFVEPAILFQGPTKSWISISPQSFGFMFEHQCSISRLIENFTVSHGKAKQQWWMCNSRNRWERIPWNEKLRFECMQKLHILNDLTTKTWTWLTSRAVFMFEFFRKHFLKYSMKFIFLNCNSQHNNRRKILAKIIIFLI